MGITSRDAVCCAILIYDRPISLFVESDEHVVAPHEDGTPDHLAVGRQKTKLVGRAELGERILADACEKRAVALPARVEPFVDGKIAPANELFELAKRGRLLDDGDAFVGDTLAGEPFFGLSARLARRILVELHGSPFGPHRAITSRFESVRAMDRTLAEVRRALFR